MGMSEKWTLLALYSGKNTFADPLLWQGGGLSNYRIQVSRIFLHILSRISIHQQKRNDYCNVLELSFCIRNIHEKRLVYFFFYTREVCRNFWVNWWQHMYTMGFDKLKKKLHSFGETGCKKLAPLLSCCVTNKELRRKHKKSQTTVYDSTNIFFFLF